MKFLKLMKMKNTLYLKYVGPRVISVASRYLKVGHSVHRHNTMILWVYKTIGSRLTLVLLSNLSTQDEIREYWSINKNSK